MWKQLYEDSSSGGPVASESNPNNVSHSYSNYDTRSLAMSAISAQHISNDANERESKAYHNLKFQLILIANVVYLI